jgi:hypothetical protein
MYEIVKQILELIPTKGRKSFSSKAKVIINGNKAQLLSYSIIICEYDTQNKSLEMLYKEKLSNTTATHLKSFKTHYNIK